MKPRKPYCPYNGCGMPNGAAPPARIVCKKCGTEFVNFDKVCPICKTCPECGRVAKKYYGDLLV